MRRYCGSIGRTAQGTILRFERHRYLSGLTASVVGEMGKFEGCWAGPNSERQIR